MKAINTAFWLTISLVAAIAVGSFALSFQALRQVAADNGVSQELAFVWPLVVDVSVIVYTLAILVAQLQRRGAKLPIALVIFFGLVTVVGNLLHAPATFTGWFVAMLPPLSLILGTEILRTMAHHNIERNEVVNSLQDLTAQLQNLNAKSIKLDADIASKNQELESIKLQIVDAKSSNNANFADKMQDKRQAKIAERRAVVAGLWQQGLDENAILEYVDVKDVRTIKRDIAAISETLPIDATSQQFAHSGNGRGGA